MPTVCRWTDCLFSMLIFNCMHVMLQLANQNPPQCEPPDADFIIVALDLLSGMHCFVSPYVFGSCGNNPTSFLDTFHVFELSLCIITITLHLRLFHLLRSECPMIGIFICVYGCSCIVISYSCC